MRVVRTVSIMLSTALHAMVFGKLVLHSHLLLVRQLVLLVGVAHVLVLVLLLCHGLLQRLLIHQHLLLSHHLLMLHLCLLLVHRLLVQ